MPESIRWNCFEKCYPVLACVDASWHLTYASQLVTERTGTELAGKRLFDIFKSEKPLPGLDLEAVNDEVFDEELFLSTKDDAYALRGKLLRCDSPNAEAYFLVATPWLEWFRKNNKPIDAENMGLALLDNQLESQLSASMRDQLLADIEDLSKDLVEQRQQADASNEARMRFVTHVSHEIRTPLNGIINSVELMANEEDRNKQKKLLNMIEQSAKSLTRLVGDVLDFSELEQGTFPIKAQVFNSRALLDELFAAHSVEALRQDIQVRLQIAPETPEWVTADRAALTKVLNSLLENAILHSHSKVIELQVSPGATVNRALTLKLEVRDFGVGIQKEDIEKCFEPFWTGRKEMTGHYSMGLGLSIARNVAVGLGGSVTAVSEPGRGSTFTFACSVQIAPAPKSQTVNRSPRHAAHPVFKGEVLLVDDNQINLELARILQTKLGLGVTTAANGKQAVEDEQRIDFDLIIMDIAMPVMNGVEATRKIRKEGRNRGVPIIAFTANVSSEDVDTYLEAGINDMLAKPASQAAIIKFCERHLIEEEQLTEAD